MFQQERGKVLVPAGISGCRGCSWVYSQVRRSEAVYKRAVCRILPLQQQRTCNFTTLFLWRENRGIHSFYAIASWWIQNWKNISFFLSFHTCNWSLKYALTLVFTLLHPLVEKCGAVLIATLVSLLWCSMNVFFSSISHLGGKHLLNDWM